MIDDQVACKSIPVWQQSSVARVVTRNKSAGLFWSINFLYWPSTEEQHQEETSGWRPNNLQALVREAKTSGGWNRWLRFYPLSRHKTSKKKQVPIIINRRVQPCVLRFSPCFTAKRLTRCIVHGTNNKCVSYKDSRLK